MISRKNTLLDQGMQCITMLVLGLSNYSFFSRELQNKLLPFMLVALALAFVAYLYDLSKYGKQDLEREERDERSQMILEKSVWYCHRAEDWVLLGLFAVCSLCWRRYDISSVIWWFMIGRYLLTFCIRWWLNRKY